MEVSLLVQSIAGLVAILGVLIFILLLPSGVKKEKKEKKETQLEIKPKNDLDSLREIIRSRLSTNKQLSDSLDLIIEFHGKIPGKLGTRVNPHFDSYTEILVTLCRHPNASKEILIGFDERLVKLNPQYKKEINDAVTKGLNSRL